MKTKSIIEGCLANGRYMDCPFAKYEFNHTDCARYIRKGQCPLCPHAKPAKHTVPAKGTGAFVQAELFDVVEE
jgi:hypothetical protein